MKRFLRGLGKEPTEDAVTTLDPTPSAVWEKQETTTSTSPGIGDAECNSDIPPAAGQGEDDGVGRDHKCRGEIDAHVRDDPSEGAATAESEKLPAPQVDERQESTRTDSPVRSADDEQRDTAGDLPQTTGTDDQIVYPGGTQLALLTLGLCLATFVVALDNTVSDLARSYRASAQMNVSCGFSTPFSQPLTRSCRPSGTGENCVCR